MTGPFEISTITKRLVVERVDAEHVRNICMIPPSGDADKDFELAQFVCDALNTHVEAQRHLRDIRKAGA